MVNGFRIIFLRVRICPVTFRFKKFRVYQNAKEYCKVSRSAIKKDVDKHDRPLSDQIGRSLNSIVLNIAEGSADTSDTEFARFLGISIRSVYESVAGFDLAVLHGYIGEDLFAEIEESAESLVKELCSFRKRLRSKSKAPE
jgi:four helix bundle protein